MAIFGAISVHEPVIVDCYDEREARNLVNLRDIYISDDSETKTIKLKANATTSVILKPETAYELTIYDYNSIYGDYTYYTITNCQTGSFNRKTWNISWDDEEKVYSLNGSLFF